MSTAYVVMEIGWEYNDEVYSRGNNGDSGGTPKKVFRDKAMAKKRAGDLNIKELTTSSYRGLNSYGYELDDIVKRKHQGELATLLERDDLEGWMEDECPLPDSMSKELAIKVLACLEVSWFEVVEVDLEE
jgi:hypothetical protein